MSEEGRGTLYKKTGKGATIGGDGCWGRRRRRMRLGKKEGGEVLGRIERRDLEDTVAT